MKLLKKIANKRRRMKIKIKNKLEGKSNPLIRWLN
jgi:hypothetical protein